MTTLIKEKWEQYSKYSKPKEFKNEWWTEELTISNNKCKIASKLPDSPENREIIRKTRREHEKAVAKARNDHWQDIVTAITDTSELAKLTKYSTSNNKLGLLTKPQGGVSEISEVADILLDEHAPG